MTDIFISYRRGDASSAALLLRYRIEQRFGSEYEVFLDLDDVKPGEPFADEIKASLLESKVVLAVAGNSYAEELKRRAGEIDWVREELLAAREAELPIWPILVDGRGNFTPDELPEDMEWLVGLNAITIATDTSDASEKLLDDLEELLGRSDRSLSFSEGNWAKLLDQLRAGACVPIIGTQLGDLDYSGPSEATLMRGSGDPALFSLFGGTDIPRVAQVLATQMGVNITRQKVRDWASGRRHDAPQANHPYAVLAGLPLPMYISTSFEDGLAAYLEAAGRSPRRIRYSASTRSIVGAGVEATAEEPIVLQLMGDHSDPNSMALTEDDFFHLLVRMVTDEEFFPIECLERLTRSTFLFIGFELADWRFRVLLRGLVQNLHGIADVFAVVSAPADQERLDDEIALGFTHRYLMRDMPDDVGQLYANVHYGGVQQFTQELAQRLAEPGP